MISAAAARAGGRSLGVVLLGLCMLVAVAWAQAAENVSFAGRNVMLNAILYRPSGSGPFPAVVALHGCAGLYARSRAMAPRYVDWAERLAANGFAVLFADSFGSRAAQSRCKTDDRMTGSSREP